MSLGGLSLSQLWPLLLGLPAILLLILLERQRRRPVLITIASLALLPPAQPGATKPRARRADLDMLLLILGTGAHLQADGGANGGSTGPGIPGGPGRIRLEQSGSPPSPDPSPIVTPAPDLGILPP